MTQKQYPKPKWAESQTVRASGLVEDICKHGVGHPNEAWLKSVGGLVARAYSIHGCDGCCCDEYREAREKEEHDALLSVE